MVKYQFIFRYEIVPCSEKPEPLVDGKVISNDTQCWDHKNSKITEEVIWKVFSFMIQLVLRLWPTLMICVLNIWMYLKLKRIQRHRNKLFGVPKKESTITSTPDTIPCHAPLSRQAGVGTFKHKLSKIVHRKNAPESLTTISGVVAKV